MSDAHSDPLKPWAMLPQVQAIAQERNRAALSGFEEAFASVFDAGVRAPTLPHPEPERERLKVAALFLKRVLTDCGSVWMNLTTGYTSQAATICAAQFEYAIACACISRDRHMSADINAADPFKLPWSVRDMCRTLDRIYAADEGIVDADASPIRPGVEAGELLYYQYEWLCKIKHPTVVSARHDAKSTTLPTGEYVIVGYPTSASADLRQKAVVAVAAIHYTGVAVRQFAIGVTTDRDAVGVKEVVAKCDEAISRALETFAGFESLPLPFSARSRGPMQGG